MRDFSEPSLWKLSINNGIRIIFIKSEFHLPSKSSLPKDTIHGRVSMQDLIPEGHTLRLFNPVQILLSYVEKYFVLLFRILLHESACSKRAAIFCDGSCKGGIFVLTIRHNSFPGEPQSVLPIPFFGCLGTLLTRINVHHYFLFKELVELTSCLVFESFLVNRN